jgi:hypothetical protein
MSCGGHSIVPLCFKSEVDTSETPWSNNVGRLGDKRVKKSAILGLHLFGLSLATIASANEPVQMTWTAAAPSQTLQAWTNETLHPLRNVSVHEKDLASGQTVSGRGVLFATLIEKTLAPLGPTQKAQVDLVILKNKSGATVQMPRWLITKYPVALLESESKGLQLILPVTSKPRIKDEGLPLQSYELSDIVGIELSSYQQNYSSYFLKNRMDPLAVRGEKLFVQNCTSCHTGKTQERSPATSLTAHPAIATSPDNLKLNSRDLRALASYLSAYRSENTAESAPPTTTATATTK